jgi:hypothetical protein
LHKGENNQATNSKEMGTSFATRSVEMNPRYALR